MSSCSDYGKDLGDGFMYIHESNQASLICDGSSLEDYDIPCAVIDYDYNERFIVAFQDNNYACKRNLIDTRYNFWIIDKDNMTRYGPLDINRYFFLSDSLGVPDDFELTVGNIGIFPIGK
jgi:hypothetical protein